MKALTRQDKARELLARAADLGAQVLAAHPDAPADPMAVFAYLSPTESARTGDDRQSTESAAV